MMTQAIQSNSEGIVDSVALSISENDLAKANIVLEKQSAAQRVSWALEHLPHNFMLSSSFGAQAAVMLHSSILMYQLC
jgi:phosphoadenosine phosphosulfate reductase